uniref:RxLR effector candidate protein n=1 Tax=Hyaloperonospora arabidopsidis (strain Emoy2) TaxID=559515 RepID=M4BV10_HYAAE
MFTRCLVYFAFVVANGIVLQVAAFDLSSVDRLNLTSSGDVSMPDAVESKPLHDEDDEEERGIDISLLLKDAVDWISKIFKQDLPVDELPGLMKSAGPEDFENWTREFKLSGGRGFQQDDAMALEHLMREKKHEDLVRLFFWLDTQEPGGVYRAKRFQKMLFEKTKGSMSTLFAKEWLKLKKHPEYVYETVWQWDGGKELWLRYFDLYRKLEDAKPISAKKMLSLLHSRYPDKAVSYGYYFQQVMKDHKDLEQLAREMQELDFTDMIKIDKMRPCRFAYNFETFESVPAHYKPNTSAEFLAFKAFTLQYASTKGEKMRQAAEKLFIKIDTKKQFKSDVAELDQFIKNLDRSDFVIL